MKNAALFVIFGILIISKGCVEVQDELMNLKEDEQSIVSIHSKYVQGWINMNEKQVMGLFTEDSRIQPNSMRPIEGKKKIREFWFPNDSSITKINVFEAELINATVLDKLGISTYSTLLDWDYKKDSVEMGMIQRGIATTLYRKNSDSQWEIWRMMWTDIEAEIK